MHYAMLHECKRYSFETDNSIMVGLVHLIKIIIKFGVAHLIEIILMDGLAHLREIILTV